MALSSHGPFYPTLLLTTSPLILAAKIVLLLLTVACVLLHKPQLTESNCTVLLQYSILVLFVTEASLLLISAFDLVFAFVVMELQTLALVAFSFLGHSHQRAATAEAVLRYFLNAAFASTSLLFGLSVFYALYGTLRADELSVLLQADLLSFSGHSGLVILGAVLIFFGVTFKLTLAPFHH